MGYDVDLAHRLAEQLGVEIQFVHVDQADWVDALVEGHCDIGMNATAVTPERARHVAFHRLPPGREPGVHRSDHRRDDFGSREALKAQKNLTLAVPPSPYYQRKLRAYLPEAELVEIQSPREFFRDETGRFERPGVRGRGGLGRWTLVYPDYSVAVPRPDVLAVPLAYIVRQEDQEWRDYLEVWLSLKEKDGTFDRLYDHWILGKDLGEATPRWCIARDVLGWLD